MIQFRHNPILDDRNKDGSFYFTLTKQNGWNEQNETGIFKDGAQITVKMGMHEIGAMEDVIRSKDTNNRFSYYHSGFDKETKGSFTYYSIPAKEQGKPDRNGFGFSVKQGDVEIKCSLTVGEAFDVLAYFNYARNQIYAAVEEKESQRRANYAAQNEQGNKKAQPAAQTSAPKKAAPKKAAPAPTPEPEPEPAQGSEPEDEDLPF